MGYIRRRGERQGNFRGCRVNLPRNPIADAGPWFRPSQAAPLLGRSARWVREMCQDGLIDHREDTGPSGAVRYLISQQAINRYVRLNTKTSRGAA